MKLNEAFSLDALSAPVWDGLMPHQRDAVAWMAASWNAGHAPLLRFPTGGGKTPVLAALAAVAAAPGTLTVLLVHRRQLVSQAMLVCAAYGTLAKDGSTWPEQGLVIMTVQRMDRLREQGKLPTAPVRAVLVDEAHHVAAPSWRRVLAALSPRVIAGVSATPGVMDGPFTVYRDGLKFTDGIDAGLLVPGRYYVPSRVALEQLKVRAGEYDDTQAETLMMVPELYGQLVPYARRIGQRSAVVYAVTVRHAQHLCDQLTGAGFTAQVVHGRMTEAQQVMGLARARSGEVQFTCCASLIDEGVDVPPLSVMMNFAPTFSARRWVQRVGRITRAYPGKPNFTVYDFTGSFDRLGPAEHLTQWGLEPHATVKPVVVSVQSRFCECGHRWQASTVEACPECGLVSTTSLWRETQADAVADVPLLMTEVPSAMGLVMELRQFLFKFSHYLSRQGSALAQAIGSKEEISSLKGYLRGLAAVTGVSEEQIALVAFGQKTLNMRYGARYLPASEQERALAWTILLMADAADKIRRLRNMRAQQGAHVGERLASLLEGALCARLIQGGYDAMFARLQGHADTALPGLLSSPEVLSRMRRAGGENVAALIDALESAPLLSSGSERVFAAQVVENIKSLPFGDRAAPHDLIVGSLLRSSPGAVEAYFGGPVVLRDVTPADYPVHARVAEAFLVYRKALECEPVTVRELDGPLAALQLFVHRSRLSLGNVEYAQLRVPQVREASPLMVPFSVAMGRRYVPSGAQHVNIGARRVAEVLPQMDLSRSPRRADW